MEPLFNLEVQQGRGSSRYPCGNISITLKQRFRKLYRLPSNGRVIILEDISTTPYHFPPVQFPPNALTSPMFLYQTLMMVLNLGQELCTFLHENISDLALILSHGGLCGFYLIANVEFVRTEVVENIEVAGGGGDAAGRRMIRKELSRIVVEKLSMKPKSHDVKQGETCAVCLDELQEREAAEGNNKRGVVVIAMPCDHLFHESCISKWFEKKVSCPLCRRGIRSADLGGSSL